VVALISTLPVVVLKVVVAATPAAAALASAAPTANASATKATSPSTKTTTSEATTSSLGSKGGQRSREEQTGTQGCSQKTLHFHGKQGSQKENGVN
jgi:hypothetical protein